MIMQNCENLILVKPKLRRRISCGHPDWEGRMSGTIEEANTSQYIIDQLVSMGYGPPVK